MDDANTAWRILANAADRMVTGELSYLDGARVILAYRAAAEIPDGDPDVAVFALIESETDHLPIGQQRAHWSADVLRKKEPDMLRAETWARRIAEREAHSLLARFSIRAGGDRDGLVVHAVLRRRMFFDEYRRSVGSLSPALLRYQPRVTCPCCGYPTLNGRADYEVCFLCLWEDDGQDDDRADEAYAGPNHSYSLHEARENFARYLSMYPPADGAGLRSSDSPEINELKAQIVSWFDEMMRESAANHDELWEMISEGERQLKRLSRVRRSYDQRRI